MRNNRRCETPRERLERYLDKSGGENACWPWMGTRMPKGYGHTSIGGRKGKLLLTHRLSYIEEYGPIPEGALVLHKCDNPPCCNPRHLHLGDKRMNAKEAYERGLLKIARGEDASGAKLTEDQVRAIRADPRSNRIVAKEYGVGKTIIGNIRLRKKWAHVT